MKGDCDKEKIIRRIKSVLVELSEEDYTSHKTALRMKK